MASNESVFQTSLLKEFRKNKYHAIKISDRFHHGIADLYVRRYDSVWIELKYLIAPKLKETLLQVNLTQNQRLFIRKEQEAGGNAGWALCVKYGPSLWKIFVGADWKTESIGQDEFLVERAKGELWPSILIYECIIERCAKITPI